MTSKWQKAAAKSVSAEKIDLWIIRKFKIHRTLKNGFQILQEVKGWAAEENQDHSDQLDLKQKKIKK